MDTDTAISLATFYDRVLPLVSDGEVVQLQGQSAFWMHKQVRGLTVVFFVFQGSRGGLIEEVLTFDLSQPIAADRVRGRHSARSCSRSVLSLATMRMKLTKGQSFAAVASEALQEVAGRIERQDQDFLDALYSTDAFP